MFLIFGKEDIHSSFPFFNRLKFIVIDIRGNASNLEDVSWWQEFTINVGFHSYFWHVRAKWELGIASKINNH